MLTGLLWQLSRPNGGEWLGMRVKTGSSIYVNTDAPDGESRSVRHWLEKHRAAYPDGSVERIYVLEPENSGLSSQDLIDLEQLARDTEARVIVIDSYMGAFPASDSNRLEQTMIPMQSLVKLAAKTGAAVIVTDHLPKRAAGERDGDRGIMGSVAKSAQARAVILLTRIPPKDCEGKTAVRLEVTKQSYAQHLEPFGVVLRVTPDEENALGAVYLEPFELPDEATHTGKYRAQQGVIQAMRLSVGEWFSRSALLQIAVRSGNIGERQAAPALHAALGELGDALEERTLKERGSPKEYRVKPLEVSGDSLPTVPPESASLWDGEPEFIKSSEAVQYANDLMHTAIASNQGNFQTPVCAVPANSDPTSLSLLDKDATAHEAILTALENGTVRRADFPQTRAFRRAFSQLVEANQIIQADSKTYARAARALEPVPGEVAYDLE